MNLSIMLSTMPIYMRLILLFTLLSTGFLYKVSYYPWKSQLITIKPRSSDKRISSSSLFSSPYPSNDLSNSSRPAWLPGKGSLVPSYLNSHNIDEGNIQYQHFEPDSSSNSIGIIPIAPSDLHPTGVKRYSRGLSPEARKYFDFIVKLAPNDMLLKFVETSPRFVQEAVMSTITTLFGSLPSYALDAALVTTNTKLANLLFQMQITGYMFKNAEYRMSLTKSLKGLPRLPSSTTIQKDNVSYYPLQEGTSMHGMVRVLTATGVSVEVDVNDLTTALSNEVSELRSELTALRGDRENELRSNLLTYIQALEDKDIYRLTSDMSQEVVDAIRMLVNALMEKMGVDNTNPEEVVVQQSLGSLAQLCMWQMVTGYKLREYEALDKGASMD